MKFFFRNIQYFLVITNIFTLSLFAQKEGVIISGFVKDAKSGQAIIGTNILLYKDSLNLDAPPYSGAAANSYGYYALPKIDKGSYIIIFRNILYNTLVKEINVTVNQGIMRIDTEMTEKEIELDEIVVEGRMMMSG